MLRRGAFVIALIGLLITIAPSALAARGNEDAPSTTIDVVAASCTGDSACDGSGPVGTDSCNGDHACTSGGSVGNNSCIGDYACFENDGVDSNSCIGAHACDTANGVSSDSCHGEYACASSNGVNGGSCNADMACLNANRSVGTNSCNAVSACQDIQESIGSNSCNGPGNCQGVAESIGDCMYNDVVPEACAVHQADGLVRRSGGKRKGNDIYNVDGTGQTAFANGRRYKRGTCRTSYVYVQNDGDVADTFTFESNTEGTAGITLQFFRRHPLTDVTAQVEAGTFTSPPVQPGKVYGITGRLCIASDAPTHSQMHVLVTVATTAGGSETITPQVVSGDTVGFQIRGK